VMRNFTGVLHEDLLNVLQEINFIKTEYIIFLKLKSIREIMTTNSGP